MSFVSTSTLILHGTHPGEITSTEHGTPQTGFYFTYDFEGRLLAENHERNHVLAERSYSLNDYTDYQKLLDDLDAALEAFSRAAIGAAVRYALQTKLAASAHRIYVDDTELQLGQNVKMFYDLYTDEPPPPPDYPGQVGGNPSNPGDPGYPYAEAEPEYGVPVYPGDPRYLPPPARVRSSLSEDAGSIFEATSLVPVESAVSETFFRGEGPGQGELYAFSELLSPDTVALRYYPQPTRNFEHLDTYRGETLLGRMSRSYPKRIMIRAKDIASFGNPDKITAQQAVDFIFSLWRDEFSWFQFEPVPDLRYPSGSIDGGVLSIEAIAIPQGDKQRRSMRQIVDEWLSVFAGTLLRQNSVGKIELVPRIGPDAPQPDLELTWHDLYTLSDGRPDPRGVVNRCRVESKAYEFREDQSLTEPAFSLACFFPRETLERNEDENLESVIATEDQRNEVDLSATQGYADGVIVDDTATVTVVYRAVIYTVRGADGNTKLPSEDLTEQIVKEGELELSRGVGNDYGFVEVIAGLSVNDSVKHGCKWQFTWVPEQGIRVSLTHDGPHKRKVGANWWMAYYIEFDLVGTSWVQANESFSGEFGYDLTTDTLPGAGGTNAVETSQQDNGEIEETIQSNVFQLTADQCQKVAQGYVIANLEPRIIYEAEQSTWNKFPVTFDHIGRPLTMPTLELALVEGRDYSDSFEFRGGSIASTFRAVVTESLIDRLSEYLYDDTGDYLRLDSGELIEPS